MAFTRHQIAVFVDGCFWHGCPTHATWPKANSAWWRNKLQDNRRRDRDTDTLLRSQGWTVLRFWEHDDVKDAAAAVLKTVRRHAV